MGYVAPQRCVAAASAAAKAMKGELSEKQVMEAFDRIDRERMRLDGRGGATGDALQRFAAEEAERAKIAAAMQKRNAALNVMVRQKVDEHLDGLMEAGLKPHEAMLAMLEGTQKAVKNARKSVMATNQAYEARYLGAMLQELQKESPHLIHLLGDAKLDRDITVEMSELRQGGHPGSTGNKDATKVAAVFSKYAEMARTDANRLGAAVGKLDGRFGPQTHDDIKMIGAGKDAWIGFVVAHLDAERTFPGMGSEDVAKSLAGVYDTLITGISDKPVSEGPVNPANLAKSLGKNRVLHFASADDAMAYRDRFGYGNTISGMIAEVRRFAKLNAAMEVFGPNPDFMVTATAERLKQRLKSSPSVSDKVKAKLEQTLDTGAGPIRHALDIATGLASRPVNVTGAKIAGDIRAMTAMAKYGGAVISSLGDTVTAAAAHQFRGSGFLKGIMTQWSGVLNGRPRGEQAEISYLLGEGFDGLIGHIVNANVANDGIVGKMGRWQDQFFKWNGLTFWTDVNRAVAARTIAAEMGMHLKKGWATIDPAYRHVMEMSGIDKARWAVMRKAILKGDNGNHYMTPDRIADLSDEDIAPLVSTGKTHDDARRDLQMDLLRYVADETSNSIVEHDNRSRRTTTAGMRPGTKGGEAIRFVMQAKSYPIAFSQRVLGRQLVGSRPGAKLEMTRNLLSLSAGLALAGYLSNTASDTLKGYWPPRDPTDAATWGAALLKSGAIGIWGDYLFAQKSAFGYNFLENLSGPTISSFSHLVELGKAGLDYGTGKALNDPDAKFSASQAVSTLIGDTPYANLFWLRPAMDYLFLNSLREAIKPGYLRSLDHNRERDYGQTRMAPAGPPRDPLNITPSF